jgi:ribosomal protein S18 acetylase RimI-like enzyme
VATSLVALAQRAGSSRGDLIAKLGLDDWMSSLAIRPALSDDAAVLARVLIDTSRIAHRGQVPDRLLDSPPLDEQYARSERNWRRTLDGIAASPSPLECILVAVENGTVIGLGMARPRRLREPQFAAYQGEISVLYVLPDHQRRGAGRQLLRALVEHLTNVGLPSFVIECVSANLPARRFYEAMGGTPVGERTIEDEGELLPSTVYGWSASDAARLLAGG